MNHLNDVRAAIHGIISPAVQAMPADEVVNMALARDDVEAPV